MNNLKFKFIAAKNFLCYGPDGIEVNLEKMGNIILVRGDNLDVSEEEERIASNGTGKSTLPEIIVYTLYGKTIKEKLKHGDVIHNKVGKGLETEVIFDKYRIVRKRKPHSLRVWESEDGVWDDSTEITLGGMPATQELIESKIGLSYETFVNTVVFTDSNKDSFLECDVPTKRKIVENLLSLGQYQYYLDNAKKQRNEFKDTINLMGKTYERLLIEKDACNTRIDKINLQEQQWKTNKKAELDVILGKIKSKREELNKTDAGQALTLYNEAQDYLENLTPKLSDLEEKQLKIDRMLSVIRDRLLKRKEDVNDIKIKTASLKSKKLALEEAIADSEKYINGLDKQIGTNCPTCFGEVKKENFDSIIKSKQDFINQNSVKLAEISLEFDQSNEALAEALENEKTLNESLKVAAAKSEEIQKELLITRREISNYSKVQKPEIEISEKRIEDQIDTLKEQAVNKKAELDGKSPYVEILEAAKTELEEKKQECLDQKSKMEKAEKELPYYEFWVEAFGDHGIRKFIIDGIIPALNSRIEYWLQFLIDGKIKLSFDNQLEELIQRNPADGDPFVYHAMSGGERRRLNLAVSQAFAHVMMINSGASPSLVFLDEVSSNIDQIGIQGLYNMIHELSKNKQVFVTTHDRDLLEMMSGCESLHLVKENGFTKIVTDE